MAVEVRIPDEAAAQHPRLLIKSRNVEGEGVVELVRPGDGQELLPPTGGNKRHIETQHKRERNQGQESVEIFYDAFKQPGRRNQHC